MTVAPERPAAPGFRMPVLHPRTRERVAAAALVLLTFTMVGIAVGGGGSDSFLVPATRRGLPHSLSGPLSRLDVNMTGAQFFWLLVAASASYLAVILLGERLRLRWVIWTIVGLHLLYAIAPPLLSKDIFSYLSYARLGVFHHVNPYLHGPAVAPHDAVYRFVGWRHVPSAYGPLFTVASYPLAYLGPAVSFWVIKVGTAFAGLACVALVWRCAERLGRNPLPAAMWVGLNPLWLAYGIGGGHNDIIMLALTMSGVALLLAGRSALGGAAALASAAVKASSIVALPFMLLRDRQPWRELAGVAVALAIVAALSLAVFGTDVFRLFHVLNTQQQLVSGDSIPAQLTHFVGLRGRHAARAQGDPRVRGAGDPVAALAGLARLRLDRGHRLGDARAGRGQHLDARAGTRSGRSRSRRCRATGGCASPRSACSSTSSPSAGRSS